VFKTSPLQGLEFKWFINFHILKDYCFIMKHYWNYIII